VAKTSFELRERVSKKRGKGALPLLRWRKEKKGGKKVSSYRREKRVACKASSGEKDHDSGRTRREKEGL